MYSTNEVGYIALQCPVSGLYHMQSEDMLVEVLDDQGSACSPGQSGRVVVTSLHTLRCPLSATISVIMLSRAVPAAAEERCRRSRRILGRTRNMLQLPGGRMAWPGFPMNTLVKLEAIRELKMIQHSLEED